MRHFCLIISVLVFSLPQNDLQAQISNQTAFEDLVLDYVRTHLDSIGFLSGYVTEGMEGVVPHRPDLDSLEIGNPSVGYDKTEKGKFLRTLEVELSYSSKKDQLVPLVSTLELDRKDLRKARNTKYVELKGEHPSLMSRFVWPGVGILAGAGTIVSLFYIRSR